MNGALLKAWLRTLVFQASWNFDRMVGLGLATAMEPLLRRLPGGRGGRRYTEAMGRAGQFFNTHPYLAGMAVGAVAKAEFDGMPGEEIRRLRNALVGPLGSVGDRLIWAGVLPATVGVGLAVSAVTSPVVGALCFLVLYNAVHLLVRSWALAAGWKSGTAVARALTAGAVQRGLKLVGPLAAFWVGAALPMVAAWLAQEFGATARLGIAAVAALGIVLPRWIVPSLGGLPFGIAALAVALILGSLW